MNMEQLKILEVDMVEFIKRALYKQGVASIFE